MMSLTEWAAQEDLRLQLKELLEHPVLKTALEVVIFNQLPSTTLAPAEVNIIEHGAILNARREGFYDFYRCLQRLTQAPPAPPLPHHAPWKGPHTLKPE